MYFSAIIHKEDNLYLAEFPEVGTVSQGCSFDEAEENLKEPTEVNLEQFTLEKNIKHI